MEWKRTHKENFLGDFKQLTLENCVIFRETISTQWQNDDDIFIGDNQLLEVYAKSCQRVSVEIQPQI